MIPILRKLRVGQKISVFVGETHRKKDTVSWRSIFAAGSNSVHGQSVLLLLSFPRPGFCFIIYSTLIAMISSSAAFMISPTSAP